MHWHMARLHITPEAGNVRTYRAYVPDQIPPYDVPIGNVLINPAIECLLDFEDEVENQAEVEEAGSKPNDAVIHG